MFSVSDPIVMPVPDDVRALAEAIVSLARRYGWTGSLRVSTPGDVVLTLTPKRIALSEREAKRRAREAR